MKPLTYYLLYFFCLLTTVIAAQNSYTISGTVTDKNDGESLFGASVVLKGTSKGVISNEYGFYSITLPEGSYTLIVSYNGYVEMQREISLKKN